MTYDCYLPLSALRRSDLMGFSIPDCSLRRTYTTSFSSFPANRDNYSRGDWEDSCRSPMLNEVLTRNRPIIICSNQAGFFLLCKVDTLYTAFCKSHSHFEHSEENFDVCILQVCSI